MVTRKPVAPPISTSDHASTSIPPYPTTPTETSAKTTGTADSVYSPNLSTSPAFDLIDMNEAQRQRSHEDDNDDTKSRDSWEDSDDEEEYRKPAGNVEGSDGRPEVKPKPLKVSSNADTSQRHEPGMGYRSHSELPAVLRPGPANGHTSGRQTDGTPYKAYSQEAMGNPWAMETSQQQPAQPQSLPYAPPGSQKHTPQPELKNRASMWWQDGSEQHVPPAPSAAPPAPPVELPTVQSPRDEMANLSFSDKHTSTASWETAEILEVPQQGRSPLPPVTEHLTEDAPPANPWSQSISPHSPPQSPSRAPPIPFAEQPQYAPPPGPPPGQPPNLLDGHERSSPVQPPRPSPISTGSAAQHISTDSIPETPQTRIRRQKSEHYSIRHINWLDPSSPHGQIRQSPVLTQNANGPCPLLALVNALVLSTPANQDTALVETLRTREQVSLGLLLDAVFDELMSGRRGDTSDDLPDVSELYAFLLALHTGMNVNPRFVTLAATPRGSLDGNPPEIRGMHPIHRSQSKVGCFEETREMRLYSTFNIPLIHGWVPPGDSPAYRAMERCAQTFEDAQNIQFAELELQDKLDTTGLNGQEQQLLQDVQTIKRFLNDWPTQLTEHGLDIISRTLESGQIAILFRNDHFSTVYKEPRHGGLMTLVTDTGYASHDEIVWESLVDVNGAASEMFSGDFRVVSHQQDARLNQGSTGGGQGGEGWQTVQSRSRYRDQQPPAPPAQQQPPSPEGPPPPLPGPRPTSQHHAAPLPGDAALSAPVDEQRRTSEQEDHDLALALQLQEEEEDAQRQAEERRRREHELSEQYLSRESTNERPPQIPPRRNNRSTPGNIPVTTRPAVNRPQDTSGGEPPPPSYEQAASDRPYREAGSTAPPQQGNPLNAYDALRQQQSAYSQSSTTVNTLPPAHQRRRSDARISRRRSSQIGGAPPGAYPGTYAGPASPRPPQVNQAAGVKDAERDCVVM